MSALAGLSDENRFSINVLSLDDHKDELRELDDIFDQRKFKFNNRTWSSVGPFAKAILKTTEDDIVVCDNFMNGVNDLTDAGHSSIETSKGTLAGFKLLTTYCEREKISPGLKIIYTQFNINGDMSRIMETRRKRGEHIHAFRKNNEESRAELTRTVNLFCEERFIVFVSRKCDYVNKLIEEWQLSQYERNALFGVLSERDSLWGAIRAGTSSKDVEARCDLIYRLKSNLEWAFPANLPRQLAWLRTKLPMLDNKSPMEFLSDGYLPKFAELILKMEGPY